MVSLWLRSVRATHAFLSEDDVQFFLPRVQTYAATDADFWIALSSESDNDAMAGWVGLDGDNIDALFVDPASFRNGVGSALLKHVQSLRPGKALTVDVNEQNSSAVRFYYAMGFTNIGRSPLDGTGKPFPLLHLRRECPPIRVDPA